MNEADRDINRAIVLRERARVASLNGLLDDASEAVSKLDGLATSSRDSVVMNAHESALGYLLARKGDLPAAADELSADPTHHSSWSNLPPSRKNSATPLPHKKRARA